jgi:transcriptional regulator with XRE-family HTH domain
MISPEVLQEAGEQERAYSELGGLIRELRGQKGLKQKELAELLGISKEYLNRIEKGRQCPSVEIIISAAEKLEASEFDLLVRSGYLEVTLEHVHYEAFKTIWDSGVISFNPKPK